MRLIDIDQRMKEWRDILQKHHPQMPCTMLHDFLLSAPIIDPNDLRKHAHWIINGDWGECSNCHESSKLAVLEHKDFCGACGAIMDEESVVITP